MVSPSFQFARSDLGCPSALEAPECERIKQRLSLIVAHEASSDEEAVMKKQATHRWAQLSSVPL